MLDNFSSLGQGTFGGKHGRTDVLRPLSWLIVILLLGATGTSFAHPDPLVQHVILYLLVASVISYLVVFLLNSYFDKDALRSETFGIQKLAIERGVYGDSLRGVIDGEASPIHQIVGDVRDVIEDSEE